MNFDFLSRTHLLLGDKGLEILQNSHVIVFGIGGIGSCAAEMLCRGGIGAITLVDGDSIALSNLNRQLHTTRDNIDQPKTVALRERLKSINPEIKIYEFQIYLKYKDEFQSVLHSNPFSYVVDSIDTLTSKCLLIESSLERKIPIISAFGAGGRMDPTKVRIADISETSHCRLAYYVRKKLHKKGIYSGVRTVYSNEVPKKEFTTLDSPVRGKKSTIGTISYMPNLFGCFVASDVIRGLLGNLHTS